MKDLFHEFEPASAANWKSRIIRDLKGEPFDGLVWHNENGFDIQPFYTAENVSAEYAPAFSHSNWSLCVRSLEADAAGANAELLKLLQNGATGISVEPGAYDLKVLLKDIRLDYISSVFTCEPAQLIKLGAFISSGDQKGSPGISLFPKNVSSSEDIFLWLNAVKPLKSGARAISVDSLRWARMGAIPVYELGLTFSLLAEWLEVAEKEKYISDAAICIRTEVSADLFMQIAKLRAMRRLWEIFKKEFGLKNDLYIIAETALSNKSLSDQHNNLLRSSVECMAAIAGGCNELLVNEFDILNGVSGSLGKRMALNQQLILKEECYMDKVADVSCGSYYIEKLTDGLAEKALDLLKQISAEGGYFQYAKKGMVEKKLQEQYINKKQKIAGGEETIVGVNKFHNEKDIAPLRDEALNYLRKQGIMNPAAEYEIHKNLNKA